MLIYLASYLGQEIAKVPFTVSGQGCHLLPV